ncbi:hypothetical protein KAR91_63615 [Candidatus Pacearchaeota archaeon]|nr:hypothetical protein [Candidatus Pacearchaeota archaeon]
MIFDKASALKMVKVSMSAVDKRRSEDIELSMGVALDEMAMRMRSSAFVLSYTETLAAGERTKTLKGNNLDLRSIFALKLGSGSTQRVLEYRESQQFLRDHDDPSAGAGQPTFWTILVFSEGFPTIKVNVPEKSSETLTVYYYVDMTPDNVGVSRSISAVVSGTLAHFYGIDSEKGVNNYQRFKELTALARASDTASPEAQSILPLSREDKKLRSVIRTMQIQRQ